jgi:predicted transposase/invertase (TIGR01784 family)
MIMCSSVSLDIPATSKSPPPSSWPSWAWAKRNWRIVDLHLKREFHGGKESVLDVKARLRSGSVIDVEIQVEMIRDLRERILFDAAKMLTGQIKRGEEYRQMEQVVSIIICDGILLPEEPRRYNTYIVRNARSGDVCPARVHRDAADILNFCPQPVIL